MRSKSRSSPIARFVGDRRGTIAIMAAVSLGVILGAAALAIDMASLYTERRQAQGAVDLAAMAAATDIRRAEDAAAATIASNNVSNIVNLTTTRGNYDVERALGLRFQDGVTPFNAAHVRLTKDGTARFARIFGVTTLPIVTEAVATSTPQAQFSIGSRLLSVEGGIANQLLSALLGGNLTLSVSDYDALLAADVSMLDTMQALATELDVTAGTYNDVLMADATVGDLVMALATVTGSNGDAAASAALAALHTQSSAASLSLPLSHLIDLGPLGGVDIGDGSPGLQSTVNVLDLVNSAATVANGSRQVTLDLATGIPGVLTMRLDLAIGEPMNQSAWVRVGEAGAALYTAQTRLRLIAEIGGTGLLSGVVIRLPLFLEAASGRGRLTAVACPGGDEAQATATIAALAGPADLWIADVSDASFADFGQSPAISSANLVNTPTAIASGRAHLKVGNVNEQDLAFAYNEFGTIKKTSTQDFGQSAVQSLLGDLELNVQTLGLSLLTPGLVSDSIATTLSSVAAPIDAVVYEILTTLGLHVGELDVSVHGVRCDGAVLVN